MNKQVKNYYNELASNYDKSRFGNSYGKFIDTREREILSEITKNISKDKILDMGCGTGRFLEFANYGVDISEQMTQIAKLKYPEKNIFNESASQTHFKDSIFELILSFHVVMHLDEKSITNILKESHRLLASGGKLVLDFPSTARRKLFRYKPKNWHGATSFSPKTFAQLLNKKWRVNNYMGIAFTPVHRIPKSFRQHFYKFDRTLCNSFLKEYSSYLIFTLEKI